MPRRAGRQPPRTTRDPSLAIPENLLAAVKVARQRCIWHPYPGCKKGGRCPFRHVANDAEDGENDLHLPHVSRHKDSINVRPPLMTAWKSFFEAHTKPMTVTNSKKVDSDILCFQLVNMRSANMIACVAAKTSACVKVETVDGKGDIPRQRGFI